MPPSYIWFGLPRIHICIQQDICFKLLSLFRSPRYDLSHTDVEDWVGRLLPSRLVCFIATRVSKSYHIIDFFSPIQFGVIVLTTANGILDHEEARRKKVGGKVLGRLTTCFKTGQWAHQRRILTSAPHFSVRFLLLMSIEGPWDRKSLSIIHQGCQTFLGLRDQLVWL